MKRLPSSLSVRAFQDAWRLSRDSKRKYGASGIDNVSPPEFSSKLKAEILDLRSQIRENEFRFKGLRVAPIKRASGKYRIIAVPNVRDRLLQRVILTYLDLDKRFSAESPISYGFIKGRTLSCAQLRALALRNKYPWVLQADIIKFFDNIKRDDVKSLVNRTVRSKLIAGLVCDAIDCELESGNAKGQAIARANGIKRGRGLRQGMPLSPMLSNLLLKGFDEELVKRSIPAVRYADDITIFAKTKYECNEYLKIVRDQLSFLELHIPDLNDLGKTNIKGPTDTVEFLGVDIKNYGGLYKLCAPRRKVIQINDEMKEICSLEFCIKNKSNIANIIKSLESFAIGHIASMSVIDESSEFINEIYAYKRKNLNLLMEEIIGSAALKNLNDDKKAVLGLMPFAP